VAEHLVDHDLEAERVRLCDQCVEVRKRPEHRVDIAIVGDPYAISLSADSRRSWLGDLDDAALKPTGWREPWRDKRSRSPLDQVIYELHVRDFSINDASVPAARRGAGSGDREQGP